MVQLFKNSCFFVSSKSSTSLENISFKIGSSFLVPIESSSKISNLKPIFKLFENSFCIVEDKTSALSIYP
ncbi:hypothetical protein N5T78_09310 [Aliarcobacter cryaerophilus]|uniref:hypothetical protein n=1 Tax=Aliarcobacter cryaerophilus TaxID=28198 RepID=UPI0021B4ED50|nr:hypothetical protein [Aliarcobacter cryaerophilus]MCT7466777.1 hypothetical protein [Aliarcobacter cryaerophilus]